MTLEARTVQPAGEVEFTAAAAHSAGEILRLADGRAAYVANAEGLASGDIGTLYTEGVVAVKKSTSVVFLPGQEIWWDSTNNQATHRVDGDLYVGVNVDGSVAATATTVLVDLNAHPKYTIDLSQDAYDLTETLGLGVTDTNGHFKLAFDAVAEIAVAEVLSRDTFSVTNPGIVEFDMAIFAIGDDAALDISVGVASATLSTDADGIAESFLIHLDGAALDIKLESDDGTTEVAATDTTVNAVDDTYFHVMLDMRDTTDMQAYINGANVLPASVFKMNAATGPLHLVANIEKTNNDTVADVRVKNFTYRAAGQS